jgi:hypothetical protein
MDYLEQTYKYKPRQKNPALRIVGSAALGDQSPTRLCFEQASLNNYLDKDGRLASRPYLNQIRNDQNEPVVD